MDNMYFYRKAKLSFGKAVYGVAKTLFGALLVNLWHSSKKTVFVDNTFSFVEAHFRAIMLATVH
jgi:hypothetical protein